MLCLAWLGLIGAVLTYILWFRSTASLELSVISQLGFLIPMTALILGWSALGQSRSVAQIFGMAVVLGRVWLN